MKLNKAQAIARRNQELGGAVLASTTAISPTLDRKRNIWWFDLPLGRIAVGHYEWIHLLMHNAGDGPVAAPEGANGVPARAYRRSGSAQLGQAQARDYVGIERGQGFVP